MARESKPVFTNFEIRPVVESQHGTCQAFDTIREARRHLNASSAFFFGLYGQEDDHTWQHVTDRASKPEMVSLIQNLLGSKLHWQDENRCTFYRSAISSPVPLQIWCNAVPAAK